MPVRMAARREEGKGVPSLSRAAWKGAAVDGDERLAGWRLPRKFLPVSTAFTSKYISEFKQFRNVIATNHLQKFETNLFRFTIVSSRFYLLL